MEEELGNNISLQSVVQRESNSSLQYSLFMYKIFIYSVPYTEGRKGLKHADEDERASTCTL